MRKSREAGCSKCDASWRKGYRQHSTSVSAVWFERNGCLHLSLARGDPSAQANPFINLKDSLRSRIDGVSTMYFSTRAESTQVSCTRTFCVCLIRQTCPILAECILALPAALGSCRTASTNRAELLPGRQTPGVRGSRFGINSSARQSQELWGRSGGVFV